MSLFTVASLAGLCALPACGYGLFRTSWICFLWADAVQRPWRAILRWLGSIPDYRLFILYYGSAQNNFISYGDDMPVSNFSFAVLGRKGGLATLTLLQALCYH